MPKFTLTPEERRDLASFVLEAPLAEPVTSRPPERLPLLERHVTFSEVEQRVFKKVCWHCHSDPVPVGGDGGPGNTGGFGYKGRGIDLGSLPSIKRGGHDSHGPIDLLAKDASGAPLLVQAMLARHVEVGGGEVPGLLGMPLGFRPIPLEDIQLVETWIAQGAPSD
jgi:hypothetical protein